jgi:hypothetical protein
LRRRIIEFNSGRNQHGNHHGNRRKPDTDNNIVRYGPVTGAAPLGPWGDGPALCAARRRKTVATASCCAWRSRSQACVPATSALGIKLDIVTATFSPRWLVCCSSAFRYAPRRWRNLIGVLVLLAFLARSVMSCGGGGSAGGGGISNPGTTTGSYTITLTGTSGSTTQTTTVNLTEN